jgi:sortase (surface protein transpeptidase)
MNKNSILKTLTSVLNIYTGLGVVLIVASTIIFLTPALPSLWYRLNTGATEQERTTISGPTQSNTDDSFDDIISSRPDPDTPELPPFDPSLTETNTLIIDSIGVIGEIHEGSNADAELDKGIWRVPSFGTPEDTNAIILAAHRFGYIYWSNDFRTKNSFYNLPKTHVGDTVKIIWNQRLYEYRIYKVEDSTTVNDYGADLIMYTCRMFNSPVRIFRYAERVN